VSVLSRSMSTGCLRGRNPEYIVSPNRYNIFEDFGPGFSFVVVLPAYFLFLTWPVIIGTVSLFYCGEYSGFPMPLGALAH
jgi:hypothetical protein